MLTPTQPATPACIRSFVSLLQELLEGVLSDPVIQASAPGYAALATTQRVPTSPLVAKLRFLALKNLAALLARTDCTAERALELYCLALAMEDDNVVLWQQMGTLVGQIFSEMRSCAGQQSSGCCIWS